MTSQTLLERYAVHTWLERNAMQTPLEQNAGLGVYTLSQDGVLGDDLGSYCVKVRC